MNCESVPWDMDFVLNEFTRTVHKPERDAATLHAECGATYHLDPDHLRSISVDGTVADNDVNKCGRCFEDGGGY